MTLTTSYWPADTSDEVRPTTIGGVLREAAAAAPDRDCDGGRHAGSGRPAALDVCRALADAEKTARALLTHFEPGEHVAVWAPNIPEWVLLQYGAALAGIVLVTVNPAYQASELEYVLRQSRAAGVFTMPEYRGNPMAKSVESVRAGLPDLREVILFSDWAGFVADGASAARALPDVQPDDAAALLYTSGTTGFPKGALLHHRGMTNDARLVSARFGLVGGEVQVSPMPLFHVGGCVLAVLGTASVAGTYIPVLAFDPALVLELVETERAAIMGGVPTMLLAMMEHPDFAKRDLSSLRVVGSGGSTVPAEIVRRIQSTLGVKFSIVFGQTECSAVATQTRLDDSPDDKAETIGQPLPNVEVKVIDPIDGDHGAARDARRALRARLLRDARLLRHARSHRRGHRPRRLAAHRRPRHHGRARLLPDRGPPQGHDHPRRREHLPARDRGRALRARGNRRRCRGRHSRRSSGASKWPRSYGSRKDAAATPAELSAYVRERMAHYKVPKTWVFVEAFPLTGSGKVQKFVLREQFVKGDLTAE